jgi:hypothetical protein
MEGGKEVVGRSGNRMRRWRRGSREVASGCADVEEEKSREEWHQDAQI